ncbi:hypothetical protein FEK47_23725 [Escherichia sp. E3659]|nr:hypothetical protein FEK47_23725 [Escherichia sp. E3659]
MPHSPEHQLIHTKMVKQILKVVARQNNFTYQSVFTKEPCPVFHAIVSIKNDGHYFPGTGVCCTDGLIETLTTGAVHTVYPPLQP